MVVQVFFGLVLYSEITYKIPLAFYEKHSNINEDIAHRKMENAGN